MMNAGVLVLQLLAIGDRHFGDRIVGRTPASAAGHDAPRVGVEPPPLPVTTRH
eukprot:COSAG01_NODE_41119_length_455_cov_2.025281_1_plen_52_part_01